MHSLTDGKNTIYAKMTRISAGFGFSDKPQPKYGFNYTTDGEDSFTFLCFTGNDRHHLRVYMLQKAHGVIISLGNIHSDTKMQSQFRVMTNIALAAILLFVSLYDWQG